MSDYLARRCSTNGCQAVIIGDEPINLVDRVYPIGTRYEDVGDSVLENAHGLEDDLRNKTVAAGWLWDGTQWLCGPCANPGSIVELMRLHAELTKIESVARSMNV